MQIRPMLSGVFNSHNEDGLYPTGIGGAAAAMLMLVLVMLMLVLMMLMLVLVMLV